MKERPILFSGPMVRAILAGTKSQTRRIVKPQPPIGHAWSGWCVTSTHRADEGKATWATGTGPFLRDVHRVACPYGQPGDRLWVRETLRAKDGFMVYAADDGRIDCDGLDWPACIEPRKTIVSIHMPRWASRLTLEITGVRVERLQDISEADARAEGINCYPFRPDDGFPICDGFTHSEDDGKCGLWPKASRAYRELWESINGPGSWDANPWVWVVTFRRADGNGESGDA